LCGYPPFHDEQVIKKYKTILDANYKFHSPYWDNVSEQAKDLILHLLVVDPKKRLTPKEALQHDWFNKVNDKEQAGTGIHTGFADKLSKYNAFQKDQTKKN